MKTTLLNFRNGERKIKFLLSAGFLFALNVSNAQTYCEPEVGVCNDGDEITNVVFAGISNPSDCDGGYSDFTALAPATITIGQPEDISVTVGFSNIEVAVWIDYNKDGVFTANEYTNLGYGEDGGTISGSITVPASAMTGTTRMRLKTQFAFPVLGDEACTVPFMGYGEFEDYSVTILPAPDCSGTPVVSIQGPASACAAMPFMLEADGVINTGLTYQWQSSVDGGNTWTNLGTAQSDLMYNVENQSEETSYRVIATCALSSESTTSDAIVVEQTNWEECYCESIPMICEEGDVILNVTIGNLNHDSDCTAGGYSDYMSLTPVELSANTSMPIAVTVGPSGDGWEFESVGVWIDYNHNGMFDESEYTYVGTGLDEVLTTDIAIPASALNGETRMRVVVAASTAENFSTDFSCGPISPDANYGEIEDYMVNITGGTMSVSDLSLKAISLYPNPTTGIVNIATAGNNINSITVYTITGRVVYSQNYTAGSDVYSIDLQNTAAGVYIVKMDTETGSEVKRIVKN